MRALARAALVATFLIALAFTTGCGEPPTKEMNEAQGAIDAARAAGADVYAGDEYKAAVDALRHAQDAAGQRDYRLALNHALDSRERAQNAAREAASARAQARSQAERLLADVTTAVAAATERLEAARSAKLPAKSLAGPEQALAGAQRSLQEAGTALGREDYLGAQKVLTDRAALVRAAIGEIDQLQAAHGGKPARKP